MTTYNVLIIAEKGGYGVNFYDQIRNTVPNRDTVSIYFTDCAITERVTSELEKAEMVIVVTKDNSFSPSIGMSELIKSAIYKDKQIYVGYKTIALPGYGVYKTDLYCEKLKGKQTSVDIRNECVINAAKVSKTVGKHDPQTFEEIKTPSILFDERAILLMI
jgi:hypothetical protein